MKNISVLFIRTYKMNYATFNMCLWVYLFELRLNVLEIDITTAYTTEF